MEQILSIVKQLTSTSSRNDKEAILAANKYNEEWNNILQFVFNPYITTGLSKKKINKRVGISRVIPYFQHLLDYIKNNNTGRDADIALVQCSLDIICKSEEERELAKQILTKEFKLGIEAKTVNKVYGKGWIPTFDVMLAEKFAENEDSVNDTFIITLKLDGTRLVIIKENGQVKMFSRQGQVVEGLVEIEEEAKRLPDNMVYDGELILRNDKNLHSAELYRETMKVVRKDGAKKNVVFHVFDMLPVDDFKNGKCNVSCIERKNKLKKVLDGNYTWIQYVKPLYIGKDKSVIPELLNKVTSEGLEGLMLNIGDAPYETKRSKGILKVKKFADADVRVVDMIEGTGKNEGKLGAITIQFEHDGQVWGCNCGSGFSDEERVLYWNNKDLLLNKIVTIGYFEISQNQNGGYGLRFPTWKGVIRDDKTEISMY